MSRIHNLRLTRLGQIAGMVMGPSGYARFLSFISALTLASCTSSPTPAPSAWDPDSIPDAYARPSGALMWPGASRAWYVDSNGSLYNGDWQVRISPSASGTPAQPPARIAAEDRWRPVLRWNRMSAGVRWSFEAIALPGVRDSGLIASLEISATNLGDAPAPARIELALGAPAGVPEFAAFDAPESIGVLSWGSGRNDRPVQGWSDRPSDGPVLAAQWTLAAHATERLRVVLPAYPESERALASWARESHGASVARGRREWDDRMALGSGLELGDRETENAVRAALVVLLSCRERRGVAWVPIGGPFHYRDVWLRDGARTIQALSLSGYAREARELAGGLLGLQWPQGAFLSQRGQLDGTGQALWAFEQAHARGGRADSLARFADASERAWHWSEWMRDLGRQTDWPYGTLMPYAEPRDNELTRAQLTGNDAWMIAGYRSAEWITRAAGRAAIADSIAAARARYLADFRAALARSPSLDVPPSWQGVGRDWGNLTAAFPSRVIEPFDSRAAALAHRVWTASGGPGLLTYGGPDTLQYYYGVDLATWALVAGEYQAADQVLEAMLRWRSASGSAGELFTRSGGDFGRNLPPHATSAAALVTLVHQALVFDDADTLMLTLGARARWWRDGHIHRAPTRWGDLDVTFRRDGDRAEWTWTAVPVWTALQLPPGTRLASDPAAPLIRSGDRRVLAPPGTRAAEVTIAAEGGSGS